MAATLQPNRSCVLDHVVHIGVAAEDGSRGSECLRQPRCEQRFDAATSPVAARSARSAPPSARRTGSLHRVHAMRTFAGIPALDTEGA